MPKLVRGLLACLIAGAVSGAVFAPAATASHIAVVDISERACTEEQVNSGRFSDVDPDSTFAVAIDCVASYGISTGNTPTTYNPAASVTRVQMALFVHRLADVLGADFALGDAGFTDISEVSEAGRAAINQLANAGVVSGTGSSPKTYSPAAPVTRAQMAAYLNRLQRALEGQPFDTATDYFDDDSETPLQSDINGLASAGIVSGTGADRAYNHRGLVTRAQMAGFMARYLEVSLASQLRLDLVTPASIQRGSTDEFPYIVSVPERSAYGAVRLDYYLFNETGLRASDVRLEFRHADGSYTEVSLEEEQPGQPGALSGSGAAFPLPQQSTSYALRLTLTSNTEPGELAIITELSSVDGDGVPVESLGETYDFLAVE